MGMDRPQRAFAPFDSDAGVMAVVDGFNAHTLAHADWNHQAHLAVGLWHVRRHGETAARALLRDGIRRFNTAVGTPNSDTRGYHETVTLFYVWAAARYLERADTDSLCGLVNGFVGDRLGSKAVIFEFWSRERLLSVEARRDWIAPDLMPLSTVAPRPPG